jgi:ABC-type transport system involved in multi-copper enzyme maturation permease subunit
MGVFLAVYRKTIGDLARPTAIIAYLAVFLTVLFFLGLGVMNEVPSAVGELPLGEQEVALLTVFLPMAWLWGVGIALLTAGSLFLAQTLVAEAESGTLELVLSKPVHRWKVLAAMALGNISFLFVLGVLSMLLVAIALYEMGGFSAAALSGGVFAYVPGILAYTLVLAILVNAVGIAVSIQTRNRLQTAAITGLLPVLFFVMFVVRVFPGEIYENYALWAVDVSYHLGNVFTLLVGAVGEPVPVETQARLAFWTGVYEVPADPTAVEGSLDLVGYVHPTVSLGLVVALILVALGFALRTFQQLEV